MNITKKILLSLSILVCGYSLTIGYNFIMGISSNARLQELSTRVFPASQLSQAVLTLFEEQIQIYQDMVATGDVSLLAHARIRASTLMKDLESLQRIARDAQLENDIAVTRQRFRTFNASAPGIYELMRKSSAEYDPVIIEKAAELARQRNAIQNDLIRYRDHYSRTLKNQLTEVGDSIYAQGVMGIVVFVLGVGISLVIIVFMVIRFIRAPLQKTINAFNTGAMGDFSTRLDATSKDEFGRLAQFFNVFMERLDQYNRDLHAEILEHKSAEEALRKSESFLKRVYDNSRIPIVVMDAATLKFIDCNPAAVVIYAFSSREEALGKTPSDVSAPVQYDGTPSAEKIMFYIDKARDEGSIVFEWRHQRQSGEIWDSEMHLMSFRDGQRDLLQFSMVDISERKQAAEALREREERLQSILDNAEEIIHMISWDGTFLYISPSWERFTGFPVAETIGKSFVTYVHTDDAPACLEVVKNVYETGRPHKIAEFRVRHASGEWIWFMNSGVAVKDAQGKPLYFLGVAVDITERKRAVDALRESEEKFRTIFEHSPLPVVITDTEGRFYDVNRKMCESIGLPREDLIGHMPSDFPQVARAVAPEDMIRAGRKLMDQGWLENEEMEMVRPLDNKRSTLLVYARLMTVTGRLLVINMLNDITERKQAEQDRARLMAILDNTSDLVSAAYPGGEVFYLNQAGYRMMGIEADEDLKGFHLSRAHPDWASHIIAQEGIPTAMAKGIWSGETAIVKKDGTEVPTSQVIMAHRSPDGSLEYLSTILRDLTESRQAEEHIRASEEKFSLAFHNSPTILTITSLRDGRFVDVNGSFLRLHGYERDEIVGHALHELDLLADRSLLESIPREVRDSGMLKDREIQLRNKEGGTFWGLFSSVPITIAGEPCLLGQGIDITERKQTEEALRRSEELYSRLVDNIPDFIIQTTQDGTISYVNDHALELSGYTKEELVGSNMLLFIAPEDRDRALENNLLRQNKKLGFQEYDLIMKDGGRISFEVNGDILRNADGTPSGTVFLCRDITQRKLAEQEKAQFQARLIQAQKMESIGTLAGGIAHDFNNILSSVLGYAELARMKNQDGESVQDDIDQVIRAGIRARDLVKQILAFSRQSEIKKEAIIIAPIVKETIKLLRASLPSTIEIRQNVSAPSATVLADPTQMHQIVMNLFTNAAHAMKDTGGVLMVDMNEVGLDRDSVQHYPGLEPGPHLRMSVSDTGTGIPATIIGKIFDPFFTTKERGEGTGMGLSVVHGIIKEMGGAITVYSEPGTGTTFHILLPLVGSKAVHTQDEGAALKRGSGRILFVDDETGILESGRKILERLGYSVAVFASPVEALEEFRQDPGAFDLVLTDLTMPKMTGLELSGLIHETRPDIPIVLCTGFGSLIPEERMRQVGIHAMVMKPMIAGELTDVVFTALELNRS